MNLEDIKQDLSIIQNMHIYFGHQSVGNNIIAGLNDLLSDIEDINFNIISLEEKSKFSEPFFAHSRLGENTDPNAKCDAFSEILRGEFVKKLDIAFLKFCYVDIKENDEPATIFEYYKSTMDSIKNKYPNLIIIHVTIPLTTVQKGWKVPIKKIMGEEIFGYTENIKRFQFNEMVKEYYKNDPIFDLSAAESTYPDGSRETFKQDGKTYYALIPDYTYDGGHLNELGRKLAAKELINVLAKAVLEKMK